tara:strand:- start:25881 stop:26318 length:438 start_codon:yes stop_codon:yes gene_type:complete
MAKKVNTGLYIGIGVGILAIGGLVFFLIKRKKQKAMMTFPTATTPSSSSSNSSSSNSSSGGSSRNQDFPLKRGSFGKRVENLQSYLNSTIQKPNLVVDGDFGRKTATALKNWNQKTEISQALYKYLEGINFTSTQKASPNSSSKR